MVLGNGEHQTNVAMRATPPPATAIRPAKMNFRQLSILAASSSISTFSRSISFRGLPSFTVAMKALFRLIDAGNNLAAVRIMTASHP